MSTLSHMSCLPLPPSRIPHPQALEVVRLADGKHWVFPGSDMQHVGGGPGPEAYAVHIPASADPYFRITTFTGGV